MPMAFRYNPDDDTIDIGGIDFANTKKWRDVQHNQRVTFLVDDASPQGAHAVEYAPSPSFTRPADEMINPRFDHFKPQFIRLRPHYIVSWGVDAHRTAR